MVRLTVFRGLCQRGLARPQLWMINHESSRHQEWIAMHQTPSYQQQRTIWHSLNNFHKSRHNCCSDFLNASEPLPESFRPRGYRIIPHACRPDVSVAYCSTSLPTVNCKSSIHSDSTKSRQNHLIETTKLTLPVRFVGASPKALRPYLRLMRMDRPIGNWLVFLPCAWSITLATPAGQLPDPKMLVLFAMGSFFMRGAGCTINDMWDKDFDSKVERTRDRPLASREVTRFKALCFLSIPLTISLAILLQFNWNTIILGACSMIPCIIYPLMKRITYWPQAFLGLTFNFGAIMGWSAVCGSLDWAVVPLYASSIAWTLVYDTIYAFQDIEDDLKIGVKSTAIIFGDHTKYWLAGFTSLITTGLFTTGYLCDQTWPYYVGVGLFATHLGHQITTVDLSSRENCGDKFRSNRNLGLIFWAAIIAANLLKHDKTTEKLDDVEEKEAAPA